MRKKKRRGEKSLEVDIISSGLEVLLRLERAADRAEEMGKPFPSLPSDDPRQQNVQNYVLNALQWLTKSEDQGSVVYDRRYAPAPAGDTSPAEKGARNAAGTHGVRQPRHKRSRVKKTTRPISPKLGRRKALNDAQQNLSMLPISPVRKATKEGLARLTNPRYKPNKYKEEMTERLKKSKNVRKIDVGELNKRLEKFAVPKRVERTFQQIQDALPTGERRRHAFGISGDRFVHDSKYSNSSAKSPGPGEYKLNTSTLSSVGARMGNYVPINPIDLVMQKASETPGPADYCPRKQDLQGGAFSTSFPPRELEMIERVHSRLPGPTHYSLPSFCSSVPGGKFNLSKPKTALEEYLHNKKYVPGPGSYNHADMQRDSGATLFSKVDRDNSPNLLALKKEGETPGPGHYNAQRGEDYVRSVRVTTFPASSPPSSLENLISRTSRLPGPNSYDSLAPIKSGKVSNGLSSWKAPVF